MNLSTSLSFENMENMENMEVGKEMPKVCMDSFETEIKDFAKFLDTKLAIDYGELPEIHYRDGGIVVLEVDDGVPCLACDEKCPGFIPHFWRNVCQKCKCPREVHDIYHEDFVNIRERLGWEEPSDTSFRCNKNKTLEHGYTWVPPGVDDSRYEEYMEQLDNHKIPKVGSAGEKYRDIQIIVQLPKQDLSEEFCRHLKTPEQKKSFEEFRHVRDATAMDIGIVQENLKDDMTCYNCQGDIETGELAVFAPKVADNVCWHPACFVCLTCDEQLVDLTYCHKERTIYCERHYAELVKPRCAACDEVCGEDLTEVPKYYRYRKGSFSHSWNDASVQNGTSTNYQNGTSSNTNGATSNLVKSSNHTKPSPSQIHTPIEDLLNTQKEVRSHEFVSNASIVHSKSKKTESDKYLLIFSGEYTKAMDQDWHSGHFCCFNCDMSLTGHRYILREEHPYCIKCYENLFANTCEECKTPIGTDSKDLSYKDKHWHEKCFKCCDCQNSLVDQPFASKNEKLYCADCHDNNFAARCDGCGDIFKAGMKKYEYRGKQWHEQCFCCKVCQQPIGSKSFIPRDQEVVCVPCYEENFAQRCMKCNGVINKGGITYKGTPWHRDCFTCNNCTKILAGEKFTSREDQPYCADCFGDLFAKKCIKCAKPITGLGGTKFISFEEKHWHSDCFNCYKCNTSLVGRGFLTDEDSILCPECGRA